MLLSKKIAYGGLSTALILVTLSVSYISPTADLALFTLSSLFIAMVVIEVDFKTGFMAYCASGLLVTAFFGIYFSIPFFVLFGVFPLIKGLLERKLNKPLAYLFKGLYFCILLIVAFFIFKEETTAVFTKVNQFLPIDFFTKNQIIWPYLFITLVVLFIYDYAISLLIEFYQQRIKKTKDRR